MTGLEQSRHMCDMSQGIMEAKAKLLERRGSGIEDENVKQLDKVKVSFVKKTGIQLAHSHVPHLLLIPAG